MLLFLLRRLGLLVPTFLGVTAIAFALIHLIPGDPLELLAGERGIDPERHARMLHELGFDQPLWRQYLDYIGAVVQGNLGTSLITRQPVLDEFMTLFPATLELSLAAMLFATLCAPKCFWRRNDNVVDEFLGRQEATEGDIAFATYGVGRKVARPPRGSLGQKTWQEPRRFWVLTIIQHHPKSSKTHPLRAAYPPLAGSTCF